jgi:hypothetical protein
MNITDHNSGSLEKMFGVKILKFFDAVADPGIFFGSGSGIRNGK